MEGVMPSRIFRKNGPAVGLASMYLASSIVIAGDIGSEVAIETHLQDGEEFEINLGELLEHGKKLFEAVWTHQEGGGRPLTKGTGNPLSDPLDPLVFPRNFNRLSAPDANSCAGCHNAPRSGGGGDIVANVFVTGQRFDFATFDSQDGVPTKGAADENGNTVTLQTLANSRNTLGMFGSGYIEMLARQMTADMQAIRDAIAPGDSAMLVSKGVEFGFLIRNADGSWDSSNVEGLPAPSLSGPEPSLVVHPFHQAGAVVSLRQFSNNAFNHHHGIQTAERFGDQVDADGDGFVNEMTRADVTAVSLWQAQLAVPGRVIPRDSDVEQAVRLGESLFADIGCTGCHVPALPLTDEGWIYTEPNPYNPAGNLQPGEAPDFALDLTNKRLDAPRLPKTRTSDGYVVMVPAYTDMKLHDITCGPDDPNREPINMHFPGGSAEFLAGNAHFLTRKLWGTANEPPYFHHGKYTTLRQAIDAHCGEAADAAAGWTGLNDDERNSVIEFLKSLQVLPEGANSLVVDEKGNPRPWK